MLRVIVPFLIGAFAAAAATYVVIERNPAAVPYVVERADVDDSASAGAARAARVTSVAIGDLGLGRREFVAEFRAWAARDADGALAALGTLENVADRRVAAAGLLTVLGSDEATIARIVAAVPGTDATSLRVEALLEHAVRDAADALQAALATPDVLARRIALTEIGAVWALDDPSTAVSSAAMIRGSADAAAFKNGVLRQWTQIDLEAFLAYFEQSYVPSGPVEATTPFVDALRLAAVIDPNRVLAFAERLDEVRARVVRASAFQVLISSNPDEALARLAAVPANVREELLPIVAAAYARVDPDAALAWVQSLDPPSPQALRAVSAMANAGGTEVTAASPLSAMAAGVGGSETAARILETRSRTDVLTAQWDPIRFRELLARAGAVTDGTGGTQYAAIQPAFQAARANPAAAFAELEYASEEVRSTIVMTIMPDWAATNPTEASRWAADVDDADLRGLAVRQVALAWGRQDLSAARNWVVDLPKDAARDTGLGALLLAVAREQGIDDSLLPEFSSGVARQTAIVSTLQSIAGRDPEQARAVLDRYVTDPDARRAGALEIERARIMTPGALRPTPLPIPGR